MIIKALIIEDEKPAASHLVKLLHESGYDIKVLQIVDSVSQTVEWFKNNPSPDIMFLDIQLADGLSFDIFNQLDIECPVIFTTAYEEYAIKAFKVNSIDYLLKPIGIEELNFALGKFIKKTPKEAPAKLLSEKVDQLMHMLTHTYKSRFIVNAGPRIHSIDTMNINYFYSLGKSTFLYGNTGKSYDIRYSLDQLETLLNPKQFFRISRKYIVNIEAIQDIIAYSNTRLKLILKRSAGDDIIVSRSRIREFKEWLEK